MVRSGLVASRHKIEISAPRQRAIGELLLAIVGRLQNVVTPQVVKQPPHLAPGHLQFRHKGLGDGLLIPLSPSCASSPSFAE